MNIYKQYLDNFIVVLKKSIILIVEDDLYISKILERTFRNNYEVFLAINGKDALGKIKEKKPDIILSDIMMDEMDGLELKKELNKIEDNALIPFIFYTAVSDESIVQAGYELGIQGYLVKPVFPIDLREKIKTVLENYNLSRLT